MRPKDNQKPYEVVLSIVCLCIILYLISRNHYFAVAGLVVGMLTLLSDKLRDAVVVAWSKVLLIVGKINGFVLLSLVFFLVLTPIAFFYRLFNKDSLALEPKGDSYFAVRDHTFTGEDLTNPW